MKKSYFSMSKDLWSYQMTNTHSKSPPPPNKLGPAYTRVYGGI